mmetsp:Transcript_11142/g.46500  ORF Transcript_11142/g.46500 Transcript_11142/m.46500 type:complete len:393 (+) Transcript_11142:1768-2946(+)
MPPLTAIPTSAATSAGASLMPSPTIATSAPRSCSPFTNASLSAGSKPPLATTLPPRPSSWAMASTAGCLSPERITTFRPISTSRRTAPAAPGLILSASAMAPMIPSPSMPTATRLHAAAAGPPVASELSAAVALSAAADPAGAPTCDSTHSGLPTYTRFPSTLAAAPRPGDVSASSARGRVFWGPQSAVTAAVAASSTAAAKGCVVVNSTAAASLSTSALVSSSLAHATPVTLGFPSVIVPVLSSATVSIWAEASRTSPPRSNSPSRAPAEVATRTAVGVARPKAHGHATTRTSVASFKAPSVAPAPPDASKSAPGKKASPAKFQNAKVVTEAAMTPYTKGPATASASRCTGAARACASATVRAIPAATLPSPAVVALTVSGPSNTPVPAET